MKKHYRKENNCLNCGTTLEGKFCHNCGQENLQLKETFGHMMTHAVLDYFHFDHQFFHTLRPLFLKPGKLTIEYMAGRRAQYLHPVKMYIFISIVYFLILFSGSHGNKHENDNNSKGHKEKLTKEQAARVKESMKNVPVLTSSQRESINKKIDAGVDTTDSVRPKISVKGTDTVVNMNSASEAPDITVKGTDTTINMNSDIGEGFMAGFRDEHKRYTDYEEYQADQEKLPKGERDGFIKNYLERKVIAWRKNGDNTKEAWVESIQHNFPKIMFVLLPIFALILKITFWRNNKFYVEHLIYSFHLHCFLFLFLAVIMLLNRTIPASWDTEDWLNTIAFIVINWYIYRSLRVVYARGRVRTITKMLGMSFMYFFAFCVVVIILAGIAAVTVV